MHCTKKFIIKGGPELGGVYIKSLLPGGSAETDGRIAIGENLLLCFVFLTASWYIISFDIKH